MFSRTVRRRALQLALRNPSAATSNTTASSATCRFPTSSSIIQRRTLTRAPKPGDGPLMERRGDRELPHIDDYTFRWGRSFPIFVVLITLSSLAIFNYQKSSSPVVASTLYALRTSPKARELLGDELQGRVDISFKVKGTKTEAVMRFASFRPGAKAMFETTEWSLQFPDGRTVDLLDGADPFKGLVGTPMSEEEREEATRGFRQQLK
ncbi:cytochrome c oxidase assembly factor 1 [Apiospora phragmitis]|uniref:Cytochrome c oxidase assembly factor 1 n=1 Tax=Apiospora phragmitis TaxID=2905665 RepID=A0ABR1WT43_9PEZI